MGNKNEIDTKKILLLKLETKVICKTKINTEIKVSSKIYRFKEILLLYMEHFNGSKLYKTQAVIIGAISWFRCINIFHLN